MLCDLFFSFKKHLLPLFDDGFNNAYWTEAENELTFVN